MHCSIMQEAQLQYKTRALHLETTRQEKSLQNTNFYCHHGQNTGHSQHTNVQVINFQAALMWQLNLLV